jgi:hypothetical protein
VLWITYPSYAVVLSQEIVDSTPSRLELDRCHRAEKIAETKTVDRRVAKGKVSKGSSNVAKD